MKSIHYIILAVMAIVTFASCEKKDYLRGVEEMDHHYYAIFVPNNNTGVSVNRNQTTLVKFPVQFYSTFTRDYDAVAKYAVVKTGISNPAVVGQDFAIVDRNGNTIPSADSTYIINFPKAVQAIDTIYIKLLNSSVAGIRKVEIQIMENRTDKFYVDIFSTAFRRPLEIK
jgi:type III secretory pathway lipoprotein EscJ